MAVTDSSEAEIEHTISRWIYSGQYRVACSCGGFRRAVPRKSKDQRRLQDRAIARHLAEAGGVAPKVATAMLRAVAIESGLVEASE